MAYEEHEHRQRAVNAARDSLAGMFDGLIIMGTWQNENGETAAVQANDGNYYAQQGMLHFMLKRREECAAIEERVRQSPGDQQDG